MLILAEGTIHHPLVGEEQSAAQAWLGPMVDGGFLQSAFIDRPRQRMWMVLSSESREEAEQRLGDMPIVRDAAVTFTLTPVSAVRFL
jgi:hypothetical protein